jgi:hypothetical protein
MPLIELRLIGDDGTEQPGDGESMGEVQISGLMSKRELLSVQWLGSTSILTSRDARSRPRLPSACGRRGPAMS